MGKSTWRQLVVDGAKYEWFLGARHIRVRAKETTGQTLFIDPFSWHFDIRPQSVCDAIRWALTNGWEPRRASKRKSKMTIKMDETGFHAL